MPVFKNVNVFFEKECSFTSEEGGESGFFSIFSLAVFFLLMVVAVVTLYNVFAKK